MTYFDRFDDDGDDDAGDDDDDDDDDDGNYNDDGGNNDYDEDYDSVHVDDFLCQFTSTQQDFLMRLFSILGGRNVWRGADILWWRVYRMPS